MKNRSIFLIFIIFVASLGGNLYSGQSYDPSFIYASDEVLPEQESAEIALNGYDPVSYLNSPLKGKEYIRAVHKGRTYLFANHLNRSLFIKNPAAYEPACGGFCALAMFKGFKVQAEPLNYKNISGKLHLFYLSFRTDARRIWERRAAEMGEEKMAEVAAARWASTYPQ